MRHGLVRKNQDAGEERCDQQQHGSDHAPTDLLGFGISHRRRSSDGLLLFHEFFELLGHLRIAKFFGIKIHNRDAEAVFHFTLAEIM